MTDSSPKQIPAILAILTMTMAGMGGSPGGGQVHGSPGGGQTGISTQAKEPPAEPRAAANGESAFVDLPSAWTEGEGSGPVVGHTRRPESASATSRPEGAPAAQDDSIRCSELRWFVDQTHQKVRRRPTTESEEQWRERLLRRLVLSRRLAARGQAEGGDSSPVLVERWNRTRDRLLTAALEQDLSSGIEVRSEEIERHYEENREKYSSPEKITTQLILLRLPPDADPDVVRAAEKRLRGIREEHLAGKPFGELARRHSQAENAGRGGIVGGSPRGSLLPEFEEAAWKLKPGEVSDVVRLPDGVALIMLNKRLAARRRGLDEARAGIEKRLRREKAQQQREAALAQVCSPWPPKIDGEPTDERPHLPPSGETVLMHLADEPVRLQDLRVDLQRPKWREELEGTLAGLCRRRLAAERGIEKRPEIADKLRFQRLSSLAAYAVDRRLKANPPEVPEEQLKALYEQHRQVFEIPEERTFEAVVVASDGDRLRPVRARAQAVARWWRSAAGNPPDARSQELWGPLPQSTLAAQTSPILAKKAFALESGEISEPLRLEHYEMGRSRFETEGYVVLRLLAVEAKTFQPFEEARGRVLRHAARDEFQQLSAQIRRQALLEAELRIDREALATCQLAVPPAGEAPAEPTARDEPAG